jgi:hypothetical protein
MSDEVLNMAGVGAGYRGRNLVRNVAIYTEAVIEDDVFLGPGCVRMSVSNPRSARRFVIASG